MRTSTNLTFSLPNFREFLMLSLFYPMLSPLVWVYLILVKGEHWTNNRNTLSIYIPAYLPQPEIALQARRTLLLTIVRIPGPFPPNNVNGGPPQTCHV